MKTREILLYAVLILSSALPAEQLIENGDFSRKDTQGRPVAWQLPSANAGVRYGVEASDLMLHSTDGKPATVVQQLSLPAGKAFVLTGETRSVKKGRYRFYVEWVHRGQGGGVYKSAGADWREAGPEWNRDVFHFSPAPGYVRCYLAVQVESGADVEFRNLRIEAVNRKGWMLDSPHALTPEGAVVVGRRSGAVFGGIPVKAGRKYRLSYVAQGVTQPGEGVPYHQIKTSVTPGVEGAQGFNDTTNSPQKKTQIFRVPENFPYQTVDVGFFLTTPGSVRFSECMLEEVKEDPRDSWTVTMLQPFYRNTFFAGDEAKDVRIAVSAGKEAAEVLAVLKTGETALAEARTALRDGKGELSIPAENLTVGEYALECRVLGPDGGVLKEFRETVAKVPASAVTVKTLPNRYLSVNGEPFLPVMWWTIHPFTPETLAYAARNGVNSTTAVVSFEGEALRKLDLARRCGLKLILEVRGPARRMSDIPEFEKKMKRILTPAVRNHPALLGYLMIDEPLWGGVPVEPLLEMYRMFKQLDPYRPVWINEAPRNEIADLRHYAAACDIWGCDIYPVPNRHSGLEDKSPACTGKYAARMNESGGFRKPVWQVLQGFNWGEAPELPPNAPAQRYPTLDESRFMMLDSMLNGATGYVLWGTQFVRDPAFLEQLFQTTDEMRKLSGLFFHGRRQADVPGTNSAVRCAVIHWNGADYLFIMNLTERLQKSRIRLGGPSRKLTVFRDGTTRQVTDGVVATELNPYEVIVCGEKELPESLWRLPDDGSALKSGNPFAPFALELARRAKLPLYDGRAAWIWEEANLRSRGQCWLFREFDAVAGDKARFSVAADDEAVVYLNGKEIGRSAGWTPMATIDLTPLLRPGKNHLVIAAADSGALPCGVLGELQIGGRVIVTDRQWLALPRRSGDDAPPSPEAWKNASPAVCVAPYGQGAWGRKVSYDR